MGKDKHVSFGQSAADQAGPVRLIADWAAGQSDNDENIVRKSVPPVRGEGDRAPGPNIIIIMTRWSGPLVEPDCELNLCHPSGSRMPASQSPLSVLRCAVCGCCVCVSMDTRSLMRAQYYIF